MFELMGVVNVTPDSFSDGGTFLKPKDAAQRVEELIAQGADWVDIGAESTRPRALGITEEEEWARLKPVFNEILDDSLRSRISLDSRHESVIKRALDYGIGFINYIGEIKMTPQFLKQVSNQNLKIAGTHLVGEPRTMQDQLIDEDKAIELVQSYFMRSYDMLRNSGFDADQIYLDPGIGFGKSDASNWKLLGATKKFAEKYQVMIGISRKSFLGRLFNIEHPIERDPVSRMLEAGLAFAGAKLIRAHEVEPLAKVRSYLMK